MEIKGDVDFLYNLNGSGWSQCKLFLETAEISIFNTHIFNNPIEELISAINKILKGEENVSFIWHREPGGHSWKIVKDKKADILNITIDKFSGDEIRNTETLVEFKIKVRQFIILVYYQMKKIAELLKDKSYNSQGNRNEDFPFAIFTEMEKLVNDN
ncbi:MAG: hypothetical protein IPJ81_16880 [Chitinophagaceae bacterium]|nr:hypothetical protein [Chitinophagaceae bacterium]